jgi:hypothetical protein
MDDPPLEEGLFRKRLVQVDRIEVTDDFCEIQHIG